jgi:branched-chain amino acid transport system substrate-binding protein
MSNPKSCVTAVWVTAFASIALVVAACEKKASENKEGQARSSAAAMVAEKASTPGVTASEIKIGQSMTYSGPVSAYGVIGKTQTAYFKMINDKGGINHRKITFMSLDDGYSPAKALENVRKLVESEGVALVFNNLGTATNAAVQKYLNERKVPHLFLATGADRWADREHFPWTIGFQASYQGEARIYARYLLREKPDAKLCVLYQNDDFGKDYLIGLKAVLGDKYDKMVIKTEAYEVAFPTIDSQIVSLQSAGCDTLLTATTPKFAAQSIRKVYDLGWKPLHIMSNVALSRSAVLIPAGLEKAVGLISASYIKDITDPELAADPGLAEFRDFASKYLAGFDLNDGNIVYGYLVSEALAKVLTQCGDDLSRENIMKQASNLKNLQIGAITTGILVNTSATDYRPIEQLQFARFNGNHFVRFGEVLATD